MFEDLRSSHQLPGFVRLHAYASHVPRHDATQLLQVTFERSLPAANNAFACYEKIEPEEWV
jgi:hypothetical protein